MKIVVKNIDVESNLTQITSARFLNQILFLALYRPFSYKPFIDHFQY